jgi:glycosyltransferase involved in cell wall biosynthesis
MRILIATGIYPPEIGGPAEYAKNLKGTWARQGHEVRVRVFSRFKLLPTGLRHLAYFLYILPAVIRTDLILSLDTFSAGLPAVLAARLFGKKIIVRTGGDFLWEFYVERTGETVLLRDFYHTRLNKLTGKERMIFRLTKFVLQKASAVVWSTEWQKEIFTAPYGLVNQKNFIIENYYGPKLQSEEPRGKNFIAMTRKLKWKNTALLQEVFNDKDIKETGATLDTDTMPHGEFLSKLSISYATIIASLGDISPNTILDAIRLNKPFILTRENGLTPRIKDIGLFVDPKEPSDVKEKVLWLANPENYARQKAKIEAFTFVHSWEEMAEEYLAVYNRLK